MVKVEDSGGNVVTTSSASISLTPSSGTLACTTNPLNASSGMATFSGCALTGTAGSGYSLNATSSGLSGATSSPTFSLATGSATQLAITTEPSSTDASGAALATQPVVKVEDSGGNVVTSVNSGSAERVDRLGRRRLHRRGRHLGRLLLGRGHLLGPGPQRRERHRLHPHLQR